VWVWFCGFGWLLLVVWCFGGWLACCSVVGVRLCVFEGWVVFFVGWGGRFEGVFWLVGWGLARIGAIVCVFLGGCGVVGCLVCGGLVLGGWDGFGVVLVVWC